VSSTEQLLHTLSKAIILYDRLADGTLKLYDQTHYEFLKPNPQTSLTHANRLRETAALIRGSVR